MRDIPNVEESGPYNMYHVLPSLSL